MAKFLPIAVVIFTILCLSCTLNVAGNRLPSNNDNSPKDSKDSTEIVPPVSSNNPSSGRVILPSAWSKEEKEDLKPNYNKNVENKEQDFLFDEKLFDEESSMWNMKKIFRQVMSLLYAVTESDDGFLEKPLNDVVFHMKTLTNNYSRDKLDDNRKTKMQNSDNTDTPDKPADDNQIQNPSTAGALNKSSDDSKTQNLSNNDSLDNRQPTDISKTEMQNTKNKDKSEKNAKTTTQNLSNSDAVNKSKDDGEAQNSPTDNALNKSSSDEKAQKSLSDDSANNRQPTEIETQNSMNKNPIDEPENNMKTESLNLENFDTQSKLPAGRELQDSTTNGSPNKSSSDRKAEKPSNNDSANNKQPTENSKIETQNDIDKDSTDKLQNNMKPETQNVENSDTRSKSAADAELEDLSTNNTLNKLSNDGQSQKSSNNDFNSNKQPLKNPNIETQTDMNEDSINKSQNNMKPGTQNYENYDSRSKSAVGEELQDSTANDALNESSNNDKKENFPKNNSFDATQPAENSSRVNIQQISINENNSNEPKDDINIQEPSNDGITMDSVSASKNEKPGEDSGNTIIKDYDDCNSGEVTMSDIPANCISEKETKEYKYYSDDKEDEEDEDEDYEDDTDESYVNENETERDSTNDNAYDNNNNINDSDVENDYVNENSYDDKNKPPSENQNPQTEITVPEKIHDQPTTLPKFITQSINNQQNYSENNAPKNQIGNNDNVTPEATQSQSLTNLEINSPGFLLSNNEFVDNYINNGQGKIPERKGEQPSNKENIIPNEKDATRKIIRVFPIFRNKLEENKRPSNDILHVNENMNDQNIPFDQSQNAIDKSWSERNSLPLPIPNEEKIYNNPKNPNQDHLYESLPQNMQNSFTSVNKPISFTQGYRKNNDIAPQNFFPLQEKPHFIDLQHTFDTPQEHYNSYVKPATFDFQSTGPSDKVFHSDTPNINEYKPEEMSPFYPKNPIPLQNVDYLNNQYPNYNFQYKETPGLNSKHNKQIEQSHPTILQPDISSNIHYISKPNTPNTPEKATYFINFESERPINTPNMEMERFPNYLTSDVLQLNPPLNQIYNQDTSPTNIEDNMDTIKAPDQLHETKPQNQNNNAQALNEQSQLDNPPFQDKLSEQQTLFPQNDVKNPSLQSEMNDKALPDKSKMRSEILPTQNESKNAEFPQSQNDTNNSKNIPQLSFNITESNLQKKLKNQDPSSVIPENIAAEAIPTQTKASSEKTFIDEPEKSKTLDDSERQEQKSSSSNSDSNIDNFGESSSDDYDSENEEESGDSTRFSDEGDYTGENNDDDDNEDIMDEDEDENQDDYISENNDGYEDDSYEDEDEDQDDYINEKNNGYESNPNEDEDENKDDYKNEKNYDENKTDRKSRNEQATVNGDKRNLDSTVTPPDFVNQAIPNQQYYSTIQSPISQINNNNNIRSEGVESTANKENPALGFESFSSSHIDDNRLGENPKKENEPLNLPDEKINDTNMQITPKHASNDGNNVGNSGNSGSPGISEIQNESGSSNSERTFDTMLEYIYTFPNNHLFKGIKEQKYDK